MRKSLITLLAAAMLVIGLVAGAQADYFDEFDYNYHVAFVDGLEGFGLPSLSLDMPGTTVKSDFVVVPWTGIPGDINIPVIGESYIPGYHYVEWGNNTPRSYLELSPVTTALTAPGLTPEEKTITVGAPLPSHGPFPGLPPADVPGGDDPPNAMYQIHINNVINGGALANGSVMSTVQLKGAGDPLAPTVLLTAFFEFSFFETPNNGSPSESADFFMVTSDQLIRNTFEYEGEDYIIDFTNAFQYLSDDLAAIGYTTADLQALGYDVSLEDGIYGWITPEERTTSVPISFTISRAPVPEPSTFALLGIGILGFAIYTRRKSE